jgi:pimeloyl-ACP methyl ester carboxylesterase
LLDRLERVLPFAGRRRAHAQLDPLELALRSRIAHPSERALRRRASLCFDAGPDGAWTVIFRDGDIRLERGRARRLDSRLVGARDVLVDVLEGETQGVEAFLDGRLFVRGNLALPLELDDLLHPRTRDIRAPRCRRVTALGVDTFYLECGPADAPPVVFFHGLGATSASFLPVMWDLARDHRVVAVDLPGFGESGKPVRPLHAEYFATWAVALLDALGIERAHLVGNSMGGRVVLEIGLRSPQRAHRLALITPSLAWRRFRIAVRLVRLLRPELGALPIPMLHAIVIQSIRNMFGDPDRVPATAMHGAADEFIRYFRSPRGRIAFFSAAREIYLESPHGRRGFWNRLSRLTVPSLFIFGTKDRLVPHAFQRYVQRAVPHASFVLLEGGGHVPQFEMPEETNRIVRGFLDGPARASWPP